MTEKDRILAEYFQERARKAGLAGGRSTSEAKKQAARKNLAKARAAKKKKA
jgi:hypothetical protein